MKCRPWSSLTDSNVEGSMLKSMLIRKQFCWEEPPMRSHTLRISVLLPAMGIIAFVGLAGAQTRDTAAVFGTITDTQGALIPGATVTLTSSGTQQVRTAKTSESGGYLFSLLPVGAYSISVEQAGFKKYERKGVVLQANENVNVSIALEVGDVKSTVSIDAQASKV